MGAKRDRFRFALRPVLAFTRTLTTSENMDEQYHLEAFLKTCKDIYERRIREDTWPWSDLTIPENMVDSEGTNYEQV